MILTNEKTGGCFIDADYHQGFKHKQIVGGDVFLLHKIKEENRIIAVLSDGLGSGVKANVLATLTATMAVSFISNAKDIRQTAEIIMKTLPVCKVRKISYSTFTIVDIDDSGNTRIIEYDNPPFILIRDNRIIRINSTAVKLKYNKYKDNVLNYSEFEARLGDRIVFFSDGVSQAGMGMKSTPLGWGHHEIEDYALKLVREKSNISARELGRSIVDRAHYMDGYKAKDDITCGVIYFRNPRKLMVLTGPPVSREKDAEMARMLARFDGKKVICGGTTAKIIARELQRTATVDLRDHDPEIPPLSHMDGVDLVTEGTITLSKLLELLEESKANEYQQRNAASAMVNLLLNSDMIYFVVGTKINDAHQDPNIPVELGIRRNLIKNIVKQLEEKYLKETKIQFI